MMHAEFSILRSVEIVSRVAIAAAVREIADACCRSHLRSVITPSCLLHASRVLENAAGSLAAMACEALPNPAERGHRS